MFRKHQVFLKSCLLTFLAYSQAAFSAVILAPETNTQRDLTADEINQVKEMLYNKSLKPYSINVYGLLQGNFNFVDTIRNNTPDFSVSHARLGVFAIENSWSGKLEVEFVGNQPRTPFPTVGSTPPLYLIESSNNTVNVRQVQINFDFFEHSSAPYTKKKPVIQTPSGEDTSATAMTDKPEEADPIFKNIYYSRISLGGIRVGGAAATAPDAANTPTGFARMDGIYLVENMVFADEASANLGFGLFNTLTTTNAGPFGGYQGWAVYPGTAPNFLGVLGVTSSSFSKAFLFSGSYAKNLTKNSSASAVAYFGFQNDAPVSTNEDGFATTTRNVNHFEGSISYNNKKIFGTQALVTGNGVTFYYEREYGSDQSLTGAAPAGLSVNLESGYTHSLYGISVGGDTANYLGNIVKDADRFIYSAGINLVDAKFKHNGLSPGLRNYTVTQFAGSIGYGYRTLEISLVSAYSMSPEKTYTRFNRNAVVNNTVAQNNNFTAYLTAALYF